MQRGHSLKVKKTNSSKKVSSETKSQKHSSEQCGGSCPFTLDSVLGTKAQKLCWGDVILSEDPDSGVEMLCWQVERGSKTQQGQEFSHQCAFNPTLHATNQDRCPVKYYKNFRDHRPPEINRVESPFFLAVKTKRSPNNPVWYMKYLLGKNELGKLLGEVAKIANLGGPHKVTNHSVHKTSISRLLDTNCPEFYVTQLSGHKCWQSLNSYKTA